MGDLVVGYYGWCEYAVGHEDDVQWGQKGMPLEKWDMELVGSFAKAAGTVCVFVCG